MANSESQIPEDILLQFVQGQEGKAWAFGRIGWSARTQDSVCKWDGVTCDEKQSVTGISLPSTDLLGTIPTEIGFLSSLRKLDFQHNVMTGTIPSQLFALPNLEEVNLSDNRLSGGLSTFASGSLTFLDLSGNHLNGTMAQDFGKRNSKLTHLDLRDNQLSGTIPSSLETLTSLVQLSLSKNSFSGTLPSFFGVLLQLKYLYLNQNHLIGTISPSWGVNGSKLTEIWLQENMISGPIPSSLSRLSLLFNFYIDGNKLTGTIPSSICSPNINSDFFKSLAKSLKSSNCGSISCPVGTIGLEGVSPCVSCNSTIIKNPYLGRKGSCHNQTEADIVAKLLARKPVDSTKIPIQLDSACDYQGVTCNQQRRVIRIDASGQGLSGTIPDELGLLQYLKALNLSSNKLTGFLPSGLRFARLEELDVSGNQLRGLVPPLLCTSAVNGNAASLTYSCDSIACSVGSYSDTGRGQCQPCDNGSLYLGSTSCNSPSAVASQTSSKSTNSHVGSIVALVFVAIAVAVSIIWVRFALAKRLKRRKASPKNLERGQIIREFQGEPNFPSAEELKTKEPTSNGPSLLVQVLMWFQRIKSRRVGHEDDEERVDFRGTLPADDRRQFVIDEDDDQSEHSELERIVMKQQMEGGTVVWEYPDPLERSVASWTADDDTDSKYDFKRHSGYPDDHPTELWLDVPNLK